MTWYCENCKQLHSDDVMCPRIQKQLRNHPELLTEAANFTTIAGQYSLISSNALNTVAQGINKVVGTNLAYEGTHQFARDIQVFKRLSEEPFKRAGIFASPERAKLYFENIKELAQTNTRVMTSFESKLTGYAQEVDWLRYKQAQLSSIYQKSELLSNNAAGIDGTTINRFTGKTLSRTTIKASKNTMTQNSTAITDVKNAISKGSATEKDIIFSTEGTKNAAEKAGLKNPVIEKNTAEQVRASNARLEEKIMQGNATTSVPMDQLGSKMIQGAVVGAAVGLTISSITNYIRFKNGELTQQEAFSEVSEDTIKSVITGATLSAITLFLPGGAIGFVSGVAIGIYVNATCSNILDEIYGKGSYRAILSSSGYVYGMTCNLASAIDKIETNMKKNQYYLDKANKVQLEIENNFELFEQMKGD